MHEHSWRKIIKSATDGNIKHLCEAGTHICVLIMPEYRLDYIASDPLFRSVFQSVLFFFFFNRGRKFVTTCRKLGLPEDLTVGALIGTLALAYCTAMVVMYVLFSLQKVS